jgi:hypothetical protein
MAVKDQLRGLLRQVIVHPRMVDSAGVANGMCDWHCYVCQE